MVSGEATSEANQATGRVVSAPKGGEVTFSDGSRIALEKVDPDDPRIRRNRAGHELGGNSLLCAADGRAGATAQ